MPPILCPGTDGTTIECDGATTLCCVGQSGAPVCAPIVTCTSEQLLCDELELPSTANNCVHLAPLNPGRLATHLDMAAAADGTLMLSGYAPGGSVRFQDLVVGMVENGEVEWSIVDGVAENVPPFDLGGGRGLFPSPDGWRGGVLPPADEPNVGEFNAIAFSPAGVVGISYYDRTNGDLKFAYSRDAGETWTVQAVFTLGDSGRYTSLAFLADGRPAISFLSLVPSEDPALRPRSLIQVAVSSVPLSMDTAPTSTDWVVSALIPEPGTAIPCRPELCGGELVCRADGNCGAESPAPDTDCVSGCTGNAECLSSPPSVPGGPLTFSCAVPLDAVEDVPAANGLYTSLRSIPTGLAVVWYDRSRRTLMGSRFDTAAFDDGDELTPPWRAPFAIDGFDVTGVGDAGYHADLFVDAMGNWHVAYVDGVEEELRHAAILEPTLGNPNPTIVRTVVDNGARLPRTGRSIVGTDADIVVLNSGEVRIVYQDATELEALLAVRAPGATDWTLQGGSLGEPLDTENSTGFWTTQTLVGDTSNIATWWVDNTDLFLVSGTRLFTFP